ncbi:MAG: ketopantoate reductase family protein [Alphaproteobacteria bacterium]|nr:ketopantoate reductase family protein [Alphaproteobacteria bacterium]
MRILSIGAGAISGYYGACLLRGGRDVTFQVRPRRAAQLAQGGLRVKAEEGDFSVPARTVAPGEVRTPFDLIIVGTKSYGLNEAMDQFAPAVGPNSIVMPILNGLAHFEILSRRFGADKVMGCAAQLSVAMDGDGVLTRVWNNTLQYGELAGGTSDRVRALYDVLSVPGLTVEAHEDIMHVLWQKFVQVGISAGVTGMMRGSIGEILAAGGKDLILGGLAECQAIATAAGNPPSQAFIEGYKEWLKTAQGSPIKASLLRDIERGAPTESEHIIGDLTARARALGVATPILDIARVHLAVYEISRRAREANGP